MDSPLVNGRYEVRRKLGEGAFSAVYEALDRARDGAPRALKVLASGRQAPSAQQLLWEFERLSRLDHPHLPHVHDLDLVRAGPLPAGAVFLVEDYVDGEPCHLALQALTGAARAAALIRLLGEGASALGYLHARGILHRDLAPQNLLIERSSGAARLVDLGLTLASGVAGTPAYMAPEALAGAPSARSDLYALGATAYHAATGRPPHAGTGAELLRSILERDPAAPDGLPEALSRLLLRLCARDPAARPGSAALLLEDLSRLSDLDLPVPEAPRGQAAAGLLCGRQSELDELVGLLERLARGEPVPPLLVVAGAPGSGRSRLCAEALRHLRLQAAAGRRPPLHVLGDTLARVAAQLSVAVPSGEPERARAAREVAVLSALSAHAPALVHLPDPGEGERALAARAAGGVEGAMVLLEDLEAPPGAHTIALTALAEDAVAQLCEGALGRPARPDFVRALRAASGGLPLHVLELVAAAGAASDRADVAALSSAGLEGLVARRLAAQPEPARRVAAALAALGAPAPAGQVLAVADAEPAALHDLIREGLLADAGATIAFPSAAHAAAALAVADPATLERALAAAPLAATRARLLEALGRTGEAAAAHVEAGLSARRALDLQAAARHLETAARAGQGQARLPLAEVLVDRGDYAAALAALATLPPSDPAVVRVRAKALQRGGDARAAEAALRAALAERDDPALRELLGRFLLARGQFDEARALDAGPEIEGLAALYQGDHAHADLCFGRAAAAAADDQQRARVALLLGNAAHLRGRFAEAAGHFERALALGTRTGDVHTAAPAAGSLGAALKELGEYAAALAPMRAAVRDLSRLGQTSWYGAALANLGLILLALGDVAAAERLAVKARTEAARRQSPLLHAFAALVEGDVRRRQGKPEQALQAYQQAEATFAGAGEVLYTQVARRARALALLDAEKPAAAAAALAGLPEDADTQLVRARVALLEGLFDEAARQATAAASAFERASRRGEAWRAHLVAARARYRAGQIDAARAALARARAGFEEIRMKTPEVYREGLIEDADARVLAASGAPPAAADSGRDEARLRRLLLVNKRLNSELRLPRLLELILDAVLEFSGAERGFVLLAGKNGELQVKAARNIDQRTLGASEFALSRSIAERAAQGGEPIVTIDAQGDERFAAALSVSDLKLRSVLAVPLRVKGRVSGTIYVDHRLRRGAFGDADVQLVLDFADQAALAIENARLMREARRARKRAEKLAGDLAARVDAQSAQLRDLSIELRESRDALAVRYNYDNLIGCTTRMLELYRLLDRVTETELPVVIYGESGTGKELAARAIHHNGPRRERPFVSENCAAIPETLLESTLFGYVRGAFTGADRDARGLFEIADGGTLFLDEVSEMSPAMQTKLLRVLQDGEFRRVGGERPRKVDVRILAASNRDLKQRVAEGRFREDLFYRLNVVKVEMPPLRERREDIPLLVDHFLVKQARGGAPRKVGPEAMARLCAYGWPGNVRELENEVSRAAALAEQLIGVADLSPQIAAATEDEGALAPGDLTLRRRVEALERSLIREALVRTAGNQTHASRLLGLSRFGLQKKLQRYRIRWQ